MRSRLPELVAVAMTFAGIAGATAVPLSNQDAALTRPPAGGQAVTLTAVAAAGVWTDEAVRGGNYWQQDFPPARPVLRAGRPAVLRLKSADVTHTFYVPALGIGPVEVEPGHVVEVPITPDREGAFDYYCTMTCGKAHFGMRGVVVVEGAERAAPAASAPPAAAYWRRPPPPPAASRAEHGKWLFHRNGCVTCHGPDGRGGVPNYNYLNDTVPALDTLARKMFLFFPEDVDRIVDALERGVPLEQLEEQAPVPRFGAVLAQYASVRDVIRHGRAAGRKDPGGPLPPLQMPAWEHHLSDGDIDAVLTYLLSLQGTRQGG